MKSEGLKMILLHNASNSESPSGRRRMAGKRVNSLVAVCLCVGTAMLFSGCATMTRPPPISPEEVADELSQQELMLANNLSSGSQQVLTAAWPILSKNTVLCEGQTSYRIGVAPPPPRPKSRFVFSVVLEVRKKRWNEPEIWGVAEDSPAAKAGIQVGDTVISVNGDATRTSAALRKALTKVAKQQDPNPVLIELKRGTKVLDPIEVIPVEVCRSNVYVADDGWVNAYADGNSVWITTGMLRFLDDDEQELQYILAHELAHNVSRHMRKRLARASVGAIADVALLAQGRWLSGVFTQLGAVSYSHRFEKEADYVAMYLLANADIDNTGIESLWRRLAAEDGAHMRANMSHPISPVRYVLMKKTREEIEEKRLAGEPLQPETN